jgi:hypothetical protein
LIVAQIIVLQSAIKTAVSAKPLGRFDSDVVDALHSKAKRKALNVDKAIADIILGGSQLT